MSEGALTAIPSRPVRFGILCDGPTLLAWQARSVEALLRVPGVILAVLIFPEASPPDHPVSRPVPAAPLPFRAYLGLRPPRALRPVDMTAAFDKIPSGRARGRRAFPGHTLLAPRDRRVAPGPRARASEGHLFKTFGALRLRAGHRRRRGGGPRRGPPRHEEWCIGIVGAPIADFLDPTREKPVRWLRPPGDGRFIADPFGARIDDAVHIVYEDFRYSTSKGLIATMEAIMEGPPRMPRVAIALAVPASYPYIIEDRGRIYCVPETNEAREVSLYRAVEFPMKWEKASTMLTGVAALDGTVFRHESRWWLGP